MSPSCWENNSRIVSWLADHGMNSSELYPYFEGKVSAILRKHGKSMMAWVSSNRQNRHPGIRTGARSSLPEVAHLARCPTSLSAQALSRCCPSGRCVSEIAVECRGGPGRGSCVALARPRAAGNRRRTHDDCWHLGCILPRARTLMRTIVRTGTTTGTSPRRPRRG